MLADIWLKGLNESVLILSNLELPALPYVASITAISGMIIFHSRNHPVALWEGDLSLLNVHEGPLGYVEGSPLILHNHFIELYRVLNTLFFKY